MKADRAWCRIACATLNPDRSPLHLLIRTHLAYVPEERQARHPLLRLKGFGYRGSEATVERTVR